MTNTVVRDIPLSLGLSTRDTWQVLGIYRNTLRKWMLGDRSPDSAALRYIEVLQELRASHPEVFEEIVARYTEA